MKQAGGVFGEVGDDEVCTGAADGEERLQDGAFRLQPAASEGGLQHGELAGDLIGAEGQIEALAGGVYDVEVGHGGLHQDHVGALTDVEFDLAQGLAEVGSIHLIAEAVAEVGGGVGGLAEGSIEGRGELGGIAENGGVVAGSGIEGGADGVDSTVHHVGGGDDVGSCLGEGDGGLGEQREGRVVVDLVAVAIVCDEAAVSVGGVLAEADVGDKDEGVEGAIVFEGTQGLLDDAVGGVGGRGAIVFVGRKAEEEKSA